MKIIHRISETLDSAMQNTLASLGIETETGLVTFEIEESHPSWHQVKSLVDQWQAVDIVTTKFTPTELRAAEQLEVVATWHHGYPQPRDDDGYLDQSFDLTNHCTSCGVGKVQSAPIRLASEPKWGKRQILQLNWLYDEFFVLPETWQKVFKPFGIEYERVIHHRTGKTLNSVVQLKIDTMASSELHMPNNAEVEHCEKCRHHKYSPISRGKFPPLTKGVDSPIVKSQEYFGSGASAWRATIVSSEVFNAIKNETLKGVDFIPAAETKARSIT